MVLGALGGLLGGLGDALGGAMGGGMPGGGPGGGAPLGVPGTGMGAPGTGIGAPRLMPPPQIAPQTGVGAPLMNAGAMGRPQGLPGIAGAAASGNPFPTPRMPGMPGGPPMSQQSMGQLMSPPDMSGMRMPARPPMPNVQQPSDASYFQRGPDGRLAPQGPMGQAPQQGGISPKVMKYADMFMGTAHAAGPGDINMTKTIEGAPKGAAFAGGDVQGSSNGGMIEPGNWKSSPNAAKAIAQFEGYNKNAYWDYKQYSVGYGSKGVKGETLSKPEALERLHSEMGQYEDAVNRYIKVPLTQNQYDALVSFTYNVGPGGLKNTSVSKALNAGNYQQAADNLMKWNKAGGKTLKGLTNRRRAERKLFMQGM